MEEPAGSVTFKRRVYIGAPTETVWEWLVDPEKCRQYSLSNLEARPSAVGDPIRYLGKIGWQLLIAGTVEEILEGRRLVHSFEFQFDPPDPPSRVTYELIRFGDAMCCLELTHDGLAPGTETLDSVTRSWDVTLSSLKTLIETGHPLPWPSRHRAR
jgi:uncharacterized protein YndB with AHSA1/START domain